MIPQYRAKKINSDEYIKGYYNLVTYNNDYETLNNTEKIEKHTIIKNFHTSHFDYEKCNFEVIEIDPSTLAIHIPDMLDSEGTKLFASLNEDGKGGDILSFIERGDYTTIIKKGKITLTFTGLHGLKYSFMLTGKNRHYKKEESKIIGIQK